MIAYPELSHSKGGYPAWSADMHVSKYEYDSPNMAIAIVKGGPLFATRSAAWGYPNLVMVVGIWILCE
ncbi:hypothetical protein VTN00DRAFT_5098 [Thermoascus crustaceus]|uniref:uncharacterized protein n=1 Tax=Thermoascus crustaceus TaxID=5088 RepID=UPI003744200E